MEKFFEFDSELLILEVQKNDCLYDCKSEDYNNRDSRLNAWTNVCQSLYGYGWDDLDFGTKGHMRKEVQKRWKSLKDAYQRSLKTREKKSGNGSSKKRPYIYEKQMWFLNTTKTSRLTTGTMDNESNESDWDANTEEEPFIIEYDTSTNDTGNSAIKKPPHKKSNSDDDYDSQFVDILRNSSSPFLSSHPSVEAQDGDKLFLLSLLPYLKEMTDFNKVDFKIKVMELIKNQMDSKQKQ
uniref:Uncharacterized protein LOC114347905 n=1 Tax=Diabrotica virgifera virgifera TaxID=50390 RepID=A0A6P7HF45_DIAVI